MKRNSTGKIPADKFYNFKGDFPRDFVLSVLEIHRRAKEKVSFDVHRIPHLADSAADGATTLTTVIHNDNNDILPLLQLNICY